MRRPRLICVGAILISLATLLVCILVMRSAGTPTRVPVSPESPVYVADIFGGNAVGQSFRASRDGLCRVDVRLRSLRGDCQVAFRLWAKGHEEEFVGGRFFCSGNKDGWYTVRFPRIARSAGGDFGWEMSLAEPIAEGIVGLEATFTDTYPAGELTINDQATGSDAVFEPFYCTTRTAPLLVADWLEWNRDKYTSWWDSGGDVTCLLALVVAMALMLVVILVLPSREEQVRRSPLLATLLSWEGCGRVWFPSLAVLGVSCVVGAALLMAAQLGLWTRSAVHLRPGEGASIESAGGPWVAYDFVANLNTAGTVVDTPEEWYVEPGWMALGTDHRPVLTMHPPSLVYYTVDVPPDAWLHAAAVMSPEVWQPDRGDGVLFIVRVIVDGVEETVYYQEIDPKSHPEDRRWHDLDADLSSYSGRTITLLFITYPLETNDWDWAAWGMPVLLAPSRPE